MRYEITIDLASLGGKTIDELGLDGAQLRLVTEGDNVEEVLYRSDAALDAVSTVVTPGQLAVQPVGASGKA